MANNKKASVWFFLFIIVAVIAAGYFFYRSIFHREVPGMRAIPSSSLFFIEASHPRQFTQTLITDNQMWKALQEIPEMTELHKDISLIDSLWNQHQNKPGAADSKLYLSFHQTNDSVHLLFVLETNKQGNSLPDKLIKVPDSPVQYISEEQNSGKMIKHFAYRQTGKSFYSSTTNGLLLLSTNRNLLLQALEQPQQKEHFTNDPVFEKISGTAGKNVDAHIYIQARKTGELIKIISKDPADNVVSLLNTFADWTELDLILKKEEVLLNGYTAGNDSLSRYISIFKGQSPSRVLMPGILPYNSSLLLHFGMEDFEAFYNNFEEYLKNTGEYDAYYQQVAGFNNKYDLNLEEQFLSWIGNEMALVSTVEKPDDYRENSYIVIKAKDPVRANQLLTEVMHNVPGSSIMKTYRDHLIKKINLPSLYQILFGDIYAFLENPYYTIVEDYVVLANNSNALEEFIRLYDSGKTLEANSNFKDFSDNVSDRSNVFLYFNTRNALSLLGSFSNENITTLLRDNQTVFKNFHAFGLQFSLVNDIFYTNAYLKYNLSYVEENRAAWKADLDAPMIGKPYLVKDHTDKTFNIIVFDEENKLYLIDSKGNLLWKIPYAGKLLSEVYPVDFYKNRKIQYLFNTDEYLYLIDLLGRKVANYPIKLNAQPTNGIAVFDYINNKDYRILFAGENKKIYNYNIKGNPVKGWKEPKGNAEATNSIQHLVSGNKDYIIIPQDDGSVLIVDRRGQRRLRIRDDFKNAPQTPFYVNQTNSKGVLITTDTKGHLIYIKSNGQTDKTVFENFSPQHYFLYADLDKNGTEDFIFLDKKRLVVYDRFKEVMFEKSFEEEIMHRPEIIPVSYRQNVLGIVSANENQILIYDDKGQQVYDGELTGSTDFAVGSLNNDKELNLLIGSGSTLYNYLLK